MNNKTKYIAVIEEQSWNWSELDWNHPHNTPSLHQPQSASPAPSAPLGAALPATKHHCSGCFFQNKSLMSAAALQDIVNNAKRQCEL